MELTLKKETITSLELLEQINFFRKEEGKKAELGHNDLLKVIRDEFEEEISLGKISQSNYISSRGKEYPMFELSLPQAKQVLVRESKHVRKKVIAYIEALENELKKRRIPQSYGEALLEAGRLAIENEKLKLEHKELEKTLELQKPKVMFADAIETAPTSILVSELAKLINQSGIEIGGNRLFEWMRENGYLIKRKGSDHNMPTQKAINLNLFEIKEGTRLSADGSIKITKTTKVTGKGQIYFINKFKKWNIIN